MGVDIVISVGQDADPIKEVKAFSSYIQPGLIDRIWVLSIL
jgi:hypothetical protein